MEQDTAAVTPITNNGKQSNGKGWKVATAIAFITAACGIGFGVYGMMNLNNNSQTSDTANGNSESLGKYEVRDLTGKTLRLLGSRNGLSIRDYYHSDTGSFAVDSGYMLNSKLITNSLDEVSKVYITLETTVLDKEKYCSYQWDNNVKADIDAALGYQASFGTTLLDCISYNKAKSDHYDLWGEDMPKINGGTKDFAYGSNSDAYFYHIIGGRGGGFSNYVVGKIVQTSKNQESAYVDINAGTFSLRPGEAGEIHSAIEGGELYKTIEENSINWDGFDLTDDDYGAFQSYRFVFKKNSDGIYSFSSVEKI